MALDLHTVFHPLETDLHTFIIAEMSCNHHGSFAVAQELVRAAAGSGADAFKAQYFRPEHMCPDSQDEVFFIPEGPWKGWRLYDLYCKARTLAPWIPKLAELSRSLGMVFVCSVYHPDDVPFVSEHADILKVSSFEANWENFLRKSVARAGKPVIVSTGALTLAQIEGLVDGFQGKVDMALLRCVSQYPASLEAFHLRTIPDMKRRFGRPVGLSDHSTGFVAATTAVALGATFIEKHLKVDEEGLDASFSADPKAFSAMVRAVRDTEKALGQINYQPTTTAFVRREYRGQWVRTAQ